jgi:hypothetical protein
MTRPNPVGWDLKAAVHQVGVPERGGADTSVVSRSGASSAEQLGHALRRDSEQPPGVTDGQARVSQHPGKPATRISRDD